MKTIRIVAPAKYIEKEAIDFAVKFLEKSGFAVQLGKHVLGQHHYFSGTQEERLFDFQQALDDEAVDYILCARGGYGSVQLIDQLDFSRFVKCPKLILGYSDITVFHCHVPRNFGIETAHTTAPLNFAENTAEALSSLLNVLNNCTNSYEVPPHSLNILGTVEAPVIGGNLAILYSLLGTNSDADYDGKILFVEEIGEAIYSVDRMFNALKKAGKLAQLKGLIVGGMTNMKDSEVPYGLSVEEVIYEHVNHLKIPVCFNFPAGHIADNRSLIIGKKASLSVAPNHVNFTQ